MMCNSTPLLCSCCMFIKVIVCFLRCTFEKRAIFKMLPFWVYVKSKYMYIDLQKPKHTNKFPPDYDINPLHKYRTTLVKLQKIFKSNLKPVYNHARMHREKPVLTLCMTSLCSGHCYDVVFLFPLFKAKTFTEDVFSSVFNCENLENYSVINRILHSCLFYIILWNPLTKSYDTHQGLVICFYSTC